MIEAHTEMLRRRHSNGGMGTRLKEEVEGIPTDDESSSDSASADSLHENTVLTGEEAAQAEESNFPSPSSLASQLLPWIGLAVWPLMLALPLALNSDTALHYATVFPRRWYRRRNGDVDVLDGTWEWGTTDPTRPLRHPLGLTLGIATVVIGHVFLLLYCRLHQQQYLGKTTPIQLRGAAQYVYWSALANHVAQPGGFVLLGMYLAVTWIYDLLPANYYNFDGGIQYVHVAACLICQDCVQFLMHRVEHVAHPYMYQISHQPHHKFTNPKLFDAFDGSVPDTALMILLPLFVTAHVVRGCNVWTYMAFGSTYANWLTLIHSEVTFPWEPTFRKLGLGTAADHHIHHKFFKYNFGHTFMWFDWIAGTYRNPKHFWKKEFNVGV